MPPRSYYIEPRPSDYLAFAKAYFDEEYETAKAFTEETGKPFLRTVQHFSSYLGVSPSLVRQVLHNPSYHYREFEIPKGDNGTRQISTPKTYLKVMQWWIVDNILSSAELSSSVHGFVRGKSYVSNAVEHLGARHVLNVDIKKFFPSISTPMMEQLFRNLGYDPDGSALLAQICSLEGCAPTGAPTSPSIGNLVLAEFDVAMGALAESAGYKYTRYADDLSFSSQERIPEEFVEKINNAVESFGFHLNDDKTKFMGPGDRIEVTGIVINQFLNLSREWRNWARGYLHRAEKNPQMYRENWQRVSGIYGSLKAVDPSEERKITQRAKSVLKLLRPTAQIEK